MTCESDCAVIDVEIRYSGKNRVIEKSRYLLTQEQAETVIELLDQITDEPEKAEEE